MGFYQDHCTYLPAMAGWFLFSSLLSTYNKVVFGSGHLAFPCPLLITSIHFLTQWLFSLFLSMLWPEFYGGYTISEMNWRTFLSTSLPCGFITACDVGLSNLALVRITLTFYTMVKASSPIFVVLSAFCFGLERVTLGLILVVCIISAGEYLTVVGEIDYDGLGMMLCLGASICSGMRWTLVQLKLNILDPPLKTAIATMRVLSPTMFLFMFMWSMILERPWITLNPVNGSSYFDSVENGFKTLCMALAGAAFAIAMILCELWLIMKSNAIVLMIGGVMKELCTILMGVTIFKDKLNPINIAGFFTVFLGVVLYKIIFHLSKMERDAANAAEGEGESCSDHHYHNSSCFVIEDGDDEGDGGGGGVSRNNTGGNTNTATNAAMNVVAKLSPKRILQRKRRLLKYETLSSCSTPEESSSSSSSPSCVATTDEENGSSVGGGGIIEVVSAQAVLDEDALENCMNDDDDDEKDAVGGGVVVANNNEEEEEERNSSSLSLPLSKQKKTRKGGYNHVLSNDIAGDDDDDDEIGQRSNFEII